jgi:CubicO group peptidase (beta-lactamase class C family)
VTAALVELENWLVEHIDIGHLMTGAQISIRCRGDVMLDFAAGVNPEGLPVDASSLMTVRCAMAKPITALCLAALVDRGVISYDTTLGEALGDPIHDELARIPLWAVASHRAGLHLLYGFELNMLRSNDRFAFARMCPPKPGWRIGVDTAFSEALGTLLLAEVVERATGRPCHELWSELCPELAASDDLFWYFTESEFAEHAHRLRINGLLRDGQRIPFTIERTPFMACEPNPSWGGYATARGLASLYEHLGALYRGEPRIGTLTTRALRAALVIPHAPPDAETPDERMAFAHGLRTGFGRFAMNDELQGRFVFGHPGYSVAYAFSDPELDLSVGIVYSGHIEMEAHLFLRVSRVVDAIYEAVNEAESMFAASR